jgi:hypothetical protein
MDWHIRKPTCQEVNDLFKLTCTDRGIKINNIGDIIQDASKIIKACGYSLQNNSKFYWCNSDYCGIKWLTTHNINVPEGYNNILGIIQYSATLCVCW